MALAILLLGLLFNLSVGIFVLARDPRSKLNRAVFALAVGFIIWQVSNYLSNVPSDITLWWNRITFIGPGVIMLSADLFLWYLQNRRVPDWYKWIAMPLTALMVLLCMTPYVVVGISPHYTNTIIDRYDLIRGWGYYVVIAWYAALLIRFVGRVFVAYKHADGIMRKQLNSVAVGVIVAGTVGLITNIILPIATGTTTATQYAPVTSVFVMGAFAFAIVRHRLFDIRMVVARTVGYSISLSVLAMAYVVIVFFVISVVFRESVSSGLQLTLFMFSALSGLAFPYIRRFFDKQTNRLFYRDVYDSQELLAVVNKIVIASVDVEVLLSSIQAAIVRYLKPQFSFFDLQATAYVSRRRIGDKIAEYSPALVTKLETLMTQNEEDIVVYDNLSPKDSEIHTIMNGMDVRLAVRLVARSGGIEQKYGLLLLGPKRSGIVYDKKDVETLRIITSELAIAVQNALQYEEIDSFNETLQDKIETATKKLRQANDKLRKLDETKDEFVSMASHQLRTPLTSVKGYLSMVLEGDGGELNDTQRQMLTQSYASSQRMVYLISDLLNLSRLNTGKFVIEAGPVDLRDVVAAEIDQLRETAKAREITLTYEPPKEFPTLMLDETKIHQVVMNFMDNAIYYTPPGGKIDITLRETASAIEFRVKDSGIGVSRNVQRHLFTKFYRADNARRMRPDGTGLGLFMAKKIIVAQGGAILFESEEGKGSLFGFRFQKASHAVESQKSTPAEPVAA